MKKIVLGKTGMEVSRIGFGGIPIQRLSEEDAIQVIIEAKNQGINLIDTAIGYTVSQKYIGKALKVTGRDSFYIATKAMAYTYDDMKASIEKSLTDMDIDYIDLYQIHNVRTKECYDNVISENGAFKALLEAKEKGLIRHIGITTHSVEYLEKFIDLHDDIIETVQYPFNIVEQQAAEAFKKANAKNIGILGMKPLAGGAIDDGKIAIKFIVANELNVVPIPGMDSIDQVRENCEAASCTDKLSDLDLDKIKQFRMELGEDFCRRCGYCMPCPQQIDIPGMFLFEGYATRYNLKDWAAARYNNLSVKADNCVKCGLCETRCPYNLPIRKKLEKVVEVFK